MSRLKFKTDIDVICGARLQQARSEADNSSGDIDALIFSERDNFAAKSRGYSISLLTILLCDVHLTADIVHGMACFDPHVLVSLPMEQVTFCFSALFQTFCLRGWVQQASESDYRDEYIEFVEYFRTSFSHLQDQPGQVKDIVRFLIVLPTLRSRKNLFYLFRQSCLCLTEGGVDLPPIKFHEVQNFNLKCRFIDMLLPAQSYLISYSTSLPNYCPSEASMCKLRETDEQFKSGQFAGDPWTHVDVDTFGRILEEFNYRFSRGSNRLLLKLLLCLLVLRPFLPQ